jgi:hypothetical protein
MNHAVNWEAIAVGKEAHSSRIIHARQLKLALKKSGAQLRVLGVNMHSRATRWL